MHWGDLLLLLALAGIVYEDFKYRAIHWWWLLILAGGILTCRPWSMAQVAINWGFLLSQFILLTLYFSIKQKSFTNIIDQFLGLGDILFLLVIALLFSPINFLLFFVVSLLLTLFFFLGYQYLFASPSSPKTIPLAGALATLLLLVLWMSEWWRHPIHLDYYTIKLFADFW